MSLTSALNTVRSIFNNSAARSSVISTNIANASNTDYTRRDATTTTSSSGASLTGIVRIQNDPLMRQLLSDISASSGRQAYSSGLLDIRFMFGGNDYETSPASYLGVVNSALQSYRTSPSNTLAAQSLVNAAGDLTRSLNSSSQAIQALRTTADREIENGVFRLNALLADFNVANDLVKSATTSGADGPNALDMRDGLLKKIAALVPVTVTARDNNDMVLTTEGGTVLFETIPRTVTFKPTATFAPGESGSAVYIDGVRLVATSTNPSGSLQAHLRIRDEIAPTVQLQLDEIARGLVQVFSEASTLDGAAQPGLFTWASSLGSGDTSAGLASLLMINPAVNISLGGDPALVRDGGINGTDYIVNPNGEGGFADRLDQMIEQLKLKQSFNPLAGIGTSASLLDFASLSIGWVEAERSGAVTAWDASSSALARSHQAYSNSTGVNFDEELIALMAVEQSYKAGTKLLKVIDDMIKSLLEIR